MARKEADEKAGIDELPDSLLFRDVVPGVIAAEPRDSLESGGDPLMSDILNRRVRSVKLPDNLEGPLEKLKGRPVFVYTPNPAPKGNEPPTI